MASASVRSCQNRILRGNKGPISTVEAFGQRIIILNDKQLAFELLDKRSSTYSERPSLVFAGEMCAIPAFL